jgi:hypothetical protein
MTSLAASLRLRIHDLTPLAVLRGSLAMVAIAAGTYGVTDTDIWGHLRFGLDTLARRALPLVDPYSFTSTQPWVNHEWLSQVFLALAYSLGGLPLLTALRAGVVAAFLLLVYDSLRRTAWPLRDVLVLATVLVASSLSRSVRPQLFSLPLYALTLAGLSRDAWWLPMVFVVWANLHGGWMLGLGAVTIWTLCQPSAKRLARLGACALATLVNPYGLGLWWSLLEAIQRGWANVAEWQPITAWSLGIDQAFIWLAIALTAAWAVRRHRPSLFAATWSVMVAIAAFRVRRHMPFFGTTVTILLAAPIAGPLPAVADNRWTRQTAVVVMALVLVCGWVSAQLVWPGATCLPAVANPVVRPEASAVQFIRSARLNGRVVMWFDWGLYAIWHTGDRLRVSIDNRRETVYSADVVSDHQRFYSGGDPDYPQRLSADYVWLPIDLPPVAQLRQRGWFPIYEGPRSMILSRTAAPPVHGIDNATTPCFPEP